MTKILVLGTAILAVNVTDGGTSWIAPGQIIPKNVATGALVVEAELPAGFNASRYTWNGMAVVEAMDASIPVVVPERVSRRQARQALLLAGLLGHVQPAIDAIPDPIQRAMAQIEWDDSQEFERRRPLVIAIGSAIGCDAAALDALFISAAGL